MADGQFGISAVRPSEKTHLTHRVEERIMFGLGFPELILVFLIVVFLFGGSRLPALGASLGQSLRNFRAGIHPDEDNRKPG